MMCGTEAAVLTGLAFYNQAFGAAHRYEWSKRMATACLSMPEPDLHVQLWQLMHKPKNRALLSLGVNEPYSHAFIPGLSLIV